MKTKKKVAFVLIAVFSIPVAFIFSPTFTENYKDPEEFYKIEKRANYYKIVEWIDHQFDWELDGCEFYGYEYDRGWIIRENLDNRFPAREGYENCFKTTQDAKIMIEKLKNNQQ